MISVGGTIALSRADIDEQKHLFKLQTPQTKYRQSTDKNKQQ